MNTQRILRSGLIIPLGLCLGFVSACGYEDEDLLPHSSREFAYTNCGGTPAVALLDGTISPLAYKDPQHKCSTSAKPGVEAFRDFVLAAYPCTLDWGIVRACWQGGTSEHKEGRAWDWGVTTQQDAPYDLLRWLLATDIYGNEYAMARHFGIMYMIFNGKIWTAYEPHKGWQRYSGSAHRDHVHFSFSWDGALKRTSYYTASAITPSTQPMITSEGPEPPYSPRFIGRSCGDNTTCSSGLCFNEASSALPYAEGMCTQRCTTYCPDRAGEPTTFCVTYDPRSGVFDGSEGYCFSQCDHGLYPGTGCRPGYTCTDRTRHNDPGARAQVCTPDGSAPATPLPPLPAFIGRECAGDQACQSGLCLTTAGELTFPEGMCAESCTKYCPDDPDEPTTFCVAFDPMTGQYGGAEGTCFTRCDNARYPANSCRPGYSCVKMERHQQPWVKRNVCLPDDGKADGYSVGEAPDAEGDLPNPEQLNDPNYDMGGGCAVGAAPEALSALWLLLGLAAWALRRKDQKK